MQTASQFRGTTAPVRAARRHRALTLLAALALVPPASAVTFSDQTSSAGVLYQQHAPVSAPNCIFQNGTFCEPERMSGGVAVGDVDGDGDLDLFVTRLDATDLLFKNNGNGTFSNATSAAGLAGLNVQSNGAAFGDIDNDGDLDLYITVLGAGGDTTNNRNYLLINNGSGVFSDGTTRGATPLIAANRRNYSVTFGDYDGDGWLDIHTTEWIPGFPSRSRLFHNKGAAQPGFFEDRTIAAGVTLDNVHGFASSFIDLDGDRCPELAVAADFGTSRLYWNNCNGTFTNGTVAAGVGTDENGMGSTFGDYDGDGDLDWFVTSIWDAAHTCSFSACGWGDSGNRLYRNEGGRLFSDATDDAGVRDGAWGWGTAFFDPDNDGDLDLVMTNGVDFPGSILESQFENDVMRFWFNDGAGVMTESAAAVGLTDTGSGKGLVVFDYDADGDQDVFLVNNGGAPRLYRNDGGNANDWLRVRTVGSGSNRQGIGARVLLRAGPGEPIRVRVIGSSGHFLGHGETVAHFGLGASSAEPVSRVTIEWPDGLVQGFDDVPRRTVLVASEADCVDADSDGYCAGLDCDDADGAMNPEATEACDGLDNDCDGTVDEEAVCCCEASGEVPGGAGVPGAPLQLVAVGGGMLQVSWSASCSAGDGNYNVYAGTLGTFATHQPVQCGTGGATSTLIPMPGGNAYYLIVPDNGALEGSYGRGSDGVERPRATAACLPQASVRGCD